MISIFLKDLECSFSNVCYILYKNNINKTQKHLKNEQRSRDDAAKRTNTSVVGKINNDLKDIYIPPYNNTPLTTLIHYNHTHRARLPSMQVRRS